MTKKLQASRLLLKKEFLLHQINISVFLQLLHLLHLISCKAKVDVAGVDYPKKGVKPLQQDSNFTTVDDCTQNHEKTATVSHYNKDFNEWNYKGLAINNIAYKIAKSETLNSGDMV